jgi:DNA repair exonuclease SbcCD nuclease subunit
MFFDRLVSLGIKVHMLAGNHDTYYKNTNDVNSPDLLLREYDNIHVIRNPQTIQVGGVDICMMPWICADNYTQSMAEMQQTPAQLCMGHFEIAGFAMYRGMESHDGLDRNVFEKFDMVFSGHYHTRSTDGQVFYLGNPYELTWQDYNDQRGFHLFNLDTRELEFVPNTYTMFEKVYYDDEEQDMEQYDISQCSEKFVKVVVVKKTDYYKFDKFMSKLYNCGAFEIKIIEDFSEFEEGEVSSDINLEDTLDVLSNYIDSVETDMSKEKLKTLMRALYTEAINMDVT